MEDEGGDTAAASQTDGLIVSEAPRPTVSLEDVEAAYALPPKQKKKKSRPATKEAPAPLIKSGVLLSDQPDERDASYDGASSQPSNAWLTRKEPRTAPPPKVNPWAARSAKVASQSPALSQSTNEYDDYDYDDEDEDEDDDEDSADEDESSFESEDEMPPPLSRDQPVSINVPRAAAPRPAATNVWSKVPKTVTSSTKAALPTAPASQALQAGSVPANAWAKTASPKSEGRAPAWASAAAHPQAQLSDSQATAAAAAAAAASAAALAASPVAAAAPAPATLYHFDGEDEDTDFAALASAGFGEDADLMPPPLSSSPVPPDASDQSNSETAPEQQQQHQHHESDLSKLMGAWQPQLPTSSAWASDYPSSSQAPFE